MNHIVGILALQGAYQKHIESLSSIGIKSTLVRKSSELDKCSALILPGGESTTISLLLQENNLYEPIIDFSKSNPVMGVCAGMILMADQVDDERIKPLGLMPFKVSRNYYGRQVHSFSADIELSFDQKPFCAPFIRAPGIERLASEIAVLAKHENNAVMIGAGNHIALSFHPELTRDTRIHEYWLRHLL
jgi:5'-phosphate synthase pdxT subunit